MIGAIEMTNKFLFLLCLLIFGACSHLPAADSVTERQRKLQEIAKLDTELKPLRLQATLEPEVIAARKESDEALRRYYEVLRKKMAELEPKMKTKINRQVKLRKEVHDGSAGSRAEDYMEAAAKKKATAVSTVP
jgi:hypothetical protein